MSDDLNTAQASFNVAVLPQTLEFKRKTFEIPPEVIKKYPPESIEVLRGCLQRLNDPDFMSGITQTKLSCRQREVAQEILFGFTARQSAQRLAIKEQSDMSHVRDIYRKLGVHNHGGFFSKIFPDIYPYQFKQIAKDFKLSSDKARVLELILSGLSKKEILKQMAITSDSFIGKMRYIYDKLCPVPEGRVDQEGKRSYLDLFLKVHTAIAALPERKPHTAQVVDQNPNLSL
jgi:DNA-binding CsgD family transcriptional regulator